ncbi:MAG TPA: hypothetical protein VMQ61_08335 [Thermoanaerobaculia bacterium]|nr:hypothetical protein [Thermoanaerobaculia bacterium]
MKPGNETAGASDRDTATIEGLLDALYESISGPAGPRDWERDRNLFAPGGVLMPTGPIPTAKPGDAPAVARVPLTFDQWLDSRRAFFNAGDFYEWEIARRIFRFGNIAHVLSAYAAGRRLHDPEILFRGINSLQLTHDGKRWGIVSIAWDNARPDNPLPEWIRTEGGGSPAPG